MPDLYSLSVPLFLVLMPFRLLRLQPVCFRFSRTLRFLIYFINSRKKIPLCPEASGIPLAACAAG